MSESSGGGSVRRSRAIVRAAVETLRRDPRLAWFPVLSGLGALVVLGLGAAIVGLGASLDAAGFVGLGPDPDPSMQRAASVAGVVVYVGMHLVMTASGVAMTHASLEALARRPWTVGEAFAIASRRRRAVVSFAIVSATVAHFVRGGRERRRGRKRRRGPGAIRRLVGLAWWAASYLALPVIVREDRSGLGAIERSATLVRTTWREIVVARFTLWWAWIPAIAAASAPILVCALLGVRAPAVLASAAALPLFALGVFALFLRTLDGIYRAALYTWATEGVVPDGFDDPDLDALWQTASPAGDG